MHTLNLLASSNYASSNCASYNQTHCVAASSPNGQECCGWSKWSVCQDCPKLRSAIHRQSLRRPPVSQLKCGVATTQFTQNTLVLETAVETGKLSFWWNWNTGTNLDPNGLKPATIVGMNKSFVPMLWGQVGLTILPYPTVPAACLPPLRAYRHCVRTATVCVPPLCGYHEWVPTATACPLHANCEHRCWLGRGPCLIMTFSSSLKASA